MIIRKFLQFIALTLAIFSHESIAAVFVVEEADSIQSTIELANDGDIIEVKPGTYEENIDFLNKMLSLESLEGPEKTIITGAGGTVVTISGDASIIGFTITGGLASFGAGMDVSGSGTLIQGNIFEDNTQSSGGFGAAIGGNVASPIIDQNIFRNNRSDMQHLSSVVGFVNGSSPRITNNIFENNESRAIGLTLPNGNAPVIMNNTIVNNWVGIYINIYGEDELALVQNNLVVGNDIGIHKASSFSANPVFKHNLVWGNTFDFKELEDFTGNNGNISNDPLFKPGTYKLAKASPAIDAGSDDDAPTHDFDGKKRPKDGNGDKVAVTDIGAYEGGSYGLYMLAISGLLFFRRKIIHH